MNTDEIILHPIAKGTRVIVHSATYSGEVISEPATIVRPAPGKVRDYYMVRYDGDRKLYARFVTQKR